MKRDEKLRELYNIIFTEGEVLSREVKEEGVTHIICAFGHYFKLHRGKTISIEQIGDGCPSCRHFAYCERYIYGICGRYDNV